MPVRDLAFQGGKNGIQIYINNRNDLNYLNYPVYFADYRLSFGPFQLPKTGHRVTMMNILNIACT